MTDPTTAIIRRHVEAITRMLIEDQKLEPGLAITAGRMLKPQGIAEIALIAEQSDMDLIHLDFTIRDDSATLSNIIVAAPRDHRCFVYTHCRLSQIPGTRHAVILPTDDVRGHFRILPGEILHLPNKPIELRREGIGFAAQRLAQLVRDGAKVNGQIDVFEVPRAA